MAVLLGVVGVCLVAAGLWGLFGWAAAAILCGAVCVLVAWFGESLPAHLFRRRQSDD